MAENTDLSFREQLNEIRKELKTLTSDMTELKASYRYHVKNSEKIEGMERDLNQARGVIRVIQWGGLFVLALIVGYIKGLDSDQNLLEQKINAAQLVNSQEILKLTNEVSINRIAITNLKIAKGIGEQKDEQ
ncbi:MULTISPECIES: hypothetical protein [Acinetobacter]|uniref:hypothetical protein n=1 Tax=Acinetobacter TaxID=469 RepID=UPI001C0DC4AB|nr:MULTISPECIES: hypothetical protein [Acinetobacter]MBU3085746.1 hypothetical protein [Acinetobacter seifertii]MCE6006335.1 hypothetical protein [Acinetobacter soli]